MSSFPDSNSPSDPPAPLFIMKADMTSVHCVLFADFAGEEHLYAGTIDGIVHIWNLKTRRRMKTLQQSDSPCLSLHVFDDHLITQDKAGLLKIWKCTEGDFKCIYSKNFDNFSFCRISFLKREVSYLAIPQSESKIDVYSLKENTPIFHGSFQCSELNGKKLGDVIVLKIIVINSTEYIAAMYEGGMFLLWNVSSKKIVIEDQLTNDTPMCFDFDSDNLQGVCGTSGDSINVFKMNTKGSIIKRKSIKMKNSGTGSLCIRPDRKILAAGCWDGRIRIFSWKNLKLLVVLECHEETVLDVAFSRDFTQNSQCKYLLGGGSSDRKISLWDIYN
ncbi:guanine nucleotide-binding protein subunit beta-like protein 1 [Planococcus citri]|uniref:guanine nucleotide-binding protein subunit beta-like protein 1 n=1 Tax=Planococcus citri TaxID=170843 RepID=UPI0031F9F4DD